MVVRLDEPSPALQVSLGLLAVPVPVASARMTVARRFGPSLFG